LTEALIQLETTSDQIEYEVIEKESSGLLGLFSKPAKIKVCKKEAVQDIAMNFLTDLFDKMEINVEVELEYNEEESTIYVELKGEEMGLLIGKRGQTLDSIQYLTSLVVNKDREDYVKIKMDTENYRERRRKTIENLAKNIASKVKKTRKPAYLEPMNPYERRIIHAVLQNDKYVETYSEGEEPYRKVVINISKEYASMPPRRNNNYRKKNSYNNSRRKPYNNRNNYKRNDNRNNNRNFGENTESVKKEDE
jgi:spoIIIJ-associated protein